MAKRDTINLHFSILPKLRGAAPVQWSIIRGYEKTGVSVFSLVDKMDAGDIYTTVETEIHPGERADCLFERLDEIGKLAVLETLEMIESGNASTTAQDESAATFAPKLVKEDGHLDFSLSATEIANRIHGTWPWPGGHAVFHHTGGKTQEVIIEAVRVADGETGNSGTVDEDLMISTGRLEIVELKPSGKRLMDWKAFCNGYRVAAGDLFTGPGKEAN